MRNGTMMDGWEMAGGFLLWLLLSVLVVIAVVALVVVLVRAATKGASPPPSAPREEQPREILDARSARGEIDREAYLQARRDLGDPAD